MLQLKCSADIHLFGMSSSGISGEASLPPWSFPLLLPATSAEGPSGPVRSSDTSFGLLSSEMVSLMATTKPSEDTDSSSELLRIDLSSGSTGSSSGSIDSGVEDKGSDVGSRVLAGGTHSDSETSRSSCAEISQHFWKTALIVFLTLAYSKKWRKTICY